MGLTTLVDQPVSTLEKILEGNQEIENCYAF